MECYLQTADWLGQQGARCCSGFLFALYVLSFYIHLKNRDKSNHADLIQSKYADMMSKQNHRDHQKESIPHFTLDFDIVTDFNPLKLV